jgi:AcrR family transcriptional regulator
MRVAIEQASGEKYSSIATSVVDFCTVLYKNRSGQGFLFDMVQKSTHPGPTAKRGRPRAYDEDTALAQAMRVFWTGGYAATSLDELSAATRMNRPSLYAAFGDKHALYGTLIERYRAMARDALAEALAPTRPLREGLRQVYDTALSIYFGGDKEPRGCFMIGTAVTEAASDRVVRASLNEGLREIDDAFAARFRRAQDDGELRHGADPAALAKLASGALYFLAIRSRSGEPRAVLERAAEAAIGLLCDTTAHTGSPAVTGRPQKR